MSDADLVEATLQVLAEHGTFGVTVDRIAHAAGISRATLYRRQVDRDALVAQAMHRAVERYREALWPVLTAPGTARERLEQALRALCATADQHLALLAGLFQQPHSPFHDHEGSGPVVLREPFAEPFERLLRDGALDGTLNPHDPVETATVVFNLVSWTYIHLRLAHRWDPDTTVERIIDVVLHGVASRHCDDSVTRPA